MAKKKATKRTGGAVRRSTGGGKLLLAFLLGAAAVAAAGFLYLHPAPFHLGGTHPEPVADHAPEHPSTAPHAVPQPAVRPEPVRRSPPFGSSEDVFEAGAHLYHGRCAGCHGTPAHTASPGALALWKKNPRSGRPGVSALAPGDIYALIADGAPARGMPAYRGVLTDTQIWQLSLLLQNAGEDLPDPVQRIVAAAGP